MTRFTGRPGRAASLTAYSGPGDRPDPTGCRTARSQPGQGGGHRAGHRRPGRARRSDHAPPRQRARGRGDVLVPLVPQQGRHPRRAGRGRHPGDRHPGRRHARGGLASQPPRARHGVPAGPAGPPQHRVVHGRPAREVGRDDALHRAHARRPALGRLLAGPRRPVDAVGAGLHQRRGLGRDRPGRAPGRVGRLPRAVPAGRVPPRPRGGRHLQRAAADERRAVHLRPRRPARRARPALAADA